MKKSLFFYAAATALMLTACSSEDDILQTGQTKQVTPQEVGFDVYTSSVNDVTRAGYQGVMNTIRLQGIAKGFGLFAFYSDQTLATDYSGKYGYYQLNTDYVPNFMWNQQVTWDDVSKGWTYAPLKYWPNETANDSQTNPDHAYMNSEAAADKRLDRLTFFAYAPYVATGAGPDGITAITSNNGKLTPMGGAQRAAADPLIDYVTGNYGINGVEDGVDLLWGVAPAGGLTYTAVNGETEFTAEGKPYINKTKPDVNTSLKFFFQHALARFGFTVAAAIDQVPQGGASGLLDPAKTTVTVEKVKLTGYFGIRGILNLNNDQTKANVANWISMNSTDLATGSTLDAAPLEKRTLTITTDLNTDIKDDGDGTQTVTVTTAKKELIKARYSQVDYPTSFSTSKAYYTDGGVEKHATMANDSYFILNGTTYEPVSGTTINSPNFPNAIPSYFTITPGSKLASDPGATTHKAVYKKIVATGNYEYYSAADVAMPGGEDFENAGYEYYMPTIEDAGITAADFTYPAGDYYLPERSYYMVVPTNNVENICTTYFKDVVGNEANREALRTVWVEITYYVTTVDPNLSAGYSRVKNVITKKVVLPSLDNGKSYNLHLLLGLTSVKVEAEVGDWKEVYVQTDLPQNTPGE